MQPFCETTYPSRFLSIVQDGPVSLDSIEEESDVTRPREPPVCARRPSRLLSNLLNPFKSASHIHCRTNYNFESLLPDKLIAQPRSYYMFEIDRLCSNRRETYLITIAPAAKSLEQVQHLLETCHGADVILLMTIMHHAVSRVCSAIFTKRKRCSQLWDGRFSYCRAENVGKS